MEEKRKVVDECIDKEGKDVFDELWGKEENDR